MRISDWSSDVCSSDLLLGFLVGDLALEFFFERHHQFDGVERVGTEVVDEGSAVADLFFLDAQLFDDDFLDAFFDAAHWLLAPVEAVTKDSVRESRAMDTARAVPFRSRACALFLRESRRKAALVAGDRKSTRLHSRR